MFLGFICLFSSLSQDVSSSHITYCTHFSWAPEVFFLACGWIRRRLQADRSSTERPKPQAARWKQRIKSLWHWAQPFNPRFFLSCSNAFSRIVCSIPFRGSNHPIVDKKNQTEFAFKLLFLNSNFVLTLGYLN